MEQTTIDTLLEQGVFTDRYRVVKLIGSGGMGNVYLAEDTILDNERVALKILHAELCREEKQVARFLREVQLTRKVTHPNVVRTFDIGNHEGRLYFTMEYAEGQNLHELFTEDPCPPELCAQIMMEILRGLAAIHEAGIIHRDLKPNNIMITTAGLLKIMDFGVARPFSSNLTSQHEIVGSAPYMAPEVWLGREVSFQADLYSLGVMIYELITGMVPFEAESAAEMMCKHLELVPVSPEVLNASVPSWLAETIMRQLRKSACDRAPGAQELAEMIELRLGAGGEQINFTQSHINISQDFEMREPFTSKPGLQGQVNLTAHDGLPLLDRPLSGGAPLTGYDWCRNELPEVSAATSDQTALSRAYSEQYSQSLSSLAAISSAEMGCEAKLARRETLKKTIRSLGFSMVTLILLASLYQLLFVNVVADMKQEGPLGIILATIINVFYGSLLVTISQLLLAGLGFLPQRSMMLWFENTAKLTLLTGLMTVISLVHLEISSSKLVPHYSLENIQRSVKRNTESVWRAALLIPPPSPVIKQKAVLKSINDKSAPVYPGNSYEYLIAFALFWIVLHNLLFVDLLKRGGLATLGLTYAFFVPLLLLQSSLDSLYSGQPLIISLPIAGHQIVLTIQSALYAIFNWLLLLTVAFFGVVGASRARSAKML